MGLSKMGKQNITRINSRTNGARGTTTHRGRQGGMGGIIQIILAYKSGYPLHAMDEIVNEAHKSLIVKRNEVVPTGWHLHGSPNS